MKKLSLILLLVLSLKGFAQPPSYVSTTCLLGWWSLDATANDLSGNGHNGTVSGAVTTNGILGAPGTAYRFNGTSDYIQVPSVASLSGFSDISISAWIKPRNLSAGAKGIVTKWYQTGGACTSNHDTYGLTVNGSSIPCGTSQNPSGVMASGVFNISDTSRFNHIVYTSTAGGTQKIYLNGVLVATAGQGSGALCSTSNPLYFGCDNNGGTLFRYFAGDIDEIGIWCRAIDSCEVRHLYNLSANGCTVIGPNPPGTGCCLGNYCSAAQNPLTGNYEIPMNKMNFNFTTPQTSAAQVLIGNAACASSFSRLDVQDDFFGKGIKGYSSSSAISNIGVHGHAVDPSGQNPGNVTIGVLGELNKVLRNKGAAVAGWCGGAPVLSSIPSGLNIAIYGNSKDNNGTYAGYFDGDLMITGNGWVNGTTLIVSDKRFKTNIKELDNVSKKIAGLKGYTYTFRTEEFKDKNFPKTEQIGFIAQELKEVFPQLVIENKEGFYGVNYSGFIPVLLQAVKEQQQQIDELKAVVSSFNTSATERAAALSINLSDKNSVVLDQNVPNPFAESTVISYNIPSDFVKAQIIFTTSGGKIIQTFDITTKGNGNLTVFANDLSHGVYIYSLVIDGKTVDTKKMIKE